MHVRVPLNHPELSILPQPVSIVREEGYFQLTQDAVIVSGDVEWADKLIADSSRDAFVVFELATKARRIDVGEIVGDKIERLHARCESGECCVVAAVHLVLPKSRECKRCAKFCAFLCD